MGRRWTRRTGAAMTTKRRTLRYLLSDDKKVSSITEQLVADGSAITHMSKSEFITKTLFDALLPKGKTARHFAEDLYSGEKDVLGSISDVLMGNVAGIDGKVAHEDYSDIVSFGREVISTKGLANSLSTRDPEFFHLRSRFIGVVKRLEFMQSNAAEADLSFELSQKIAYGKDLIREIDPDRAGTAPAYALVSFALDNFDLIGSWQDTCSYLGDVFLILDISAINRRKLPASWISEDTPQLRRDWVEVLKSVVDSWR